MTIEPVGVTESHASPPHSSLLIFLIADIRGYTRFTAEHGDEAAARLAAYFAEIAEEVVASHNGKVVELRGDEALCAFPLARGALRCAVALQGAFARSLAAEPSLPLRVGVGLDAGEAIPVRGGYRGGALNLAARLCALAGPGEVLSSDGVIHLAGKIERLSYRDRGQVRLKGFAAPVTVVVVTREHDPSVDGTAPATDESTDQPSAQELPIGGFLGALPDNRLVGREEELGQVIEAVDTVVGGAGRLVTLVGEPGVGKTRLAQEVTLHLRNRGFLIASGRCYEPQRDVPYYPFLEALAHAYVRAPAAVRAEAPRRWPYLGVLLPDDFGTLERLSIRGQDEQQRLFQAVTGFLVAIAEAMPVALLVDDLHWADATSLDVLKHLARHTRAYRILLLGTYRDVEVQRGHPLRQALHDLNREHLVKRVAIQRFGQEGTAALITTTLDEPELSAEFAQLVHRHTEGNPFFTDEVLRALIDRGDLYRQDDRWARRNLEEIEVPESIRDAIGERLSHLPGQTQDLLRQASVLGQSFGFEELQRMSGSGEEEIEGALEQARESELIREQGREGYAFNHALTQQTLYQELSSRQRRRLHRAAGEALEQPTKRGQTRRAAELARHFLEADDAERALHYSLLAGEEANYLCAWSEAERHSRVALQLAREIGDQGGEIEALWWLGSAFFERAQYGNAQETWNQATQLAEVRGDLAKLSELLSWNGRTYLNVGELEQSKSYLERAIPLAERAGDADSLANAILALASVFSCQGDWATARRYLQQVAELSRKPDLDCAIGMPHLVHLDLAKIALAEGSYEAASRHVQEGIQKAQGINMPMAGLYGQWLLAQLELLDGCPEAALARIAIVRDDPRIGTENLIEVLPILTDVYVALGELARAEETADECVREARETNHVLALPTALTARGMVLSKQRRWEDAAQALEEAITVAHELPYVYAEARALHEYGMMLSSMPNIGDATIRERANDAVSQALAIFRKLDATKDVRWAEQALAEIVPG